MFASFLVSLSLLPVLVAVVGLLFRLKDEGGEWIGANSIGS